jgi:hypothetical protein
LVHLSVSKFPWGIIPVSDRDCRVEVYAAGVFAQRAPDAVNNTGPGQPGSRLAGQVWMRAGRDPLQDAGATPCNLLDGKAHKNPQRDRLRICVRERQGRALQRKVGNSRSATQGRQSKAAVEKPAIKTDWKILACRFNESRRASRGYPWQGYIRRKLTSTP